MSIPADDPAERLRRIGVATAGVAHDLNNILAGIDAIAASATERPGLAAKLAEDLAEIRAAVARGAGLVRGLLATGERPRQPPRPRPLDPELTAAARMIRRLMPPGIRLETRLGASGARVRIDPDRLLAALLNLAINARHAMGGTGALRLLSAVHTLRGPLPTLPAPAQSETVPPGRYAVVSLRDSGPGLTAESAMRLFTPFASSRPDGHGIGLLSVRDTLRAAGGYLVLGGRSGHGLAARMVLPLEAPAPAEPASIWLVEDEGDLRKIFARALTALGWKVRSSDCAEAALAEIGPGAPRPRLLVCDVSLPDIDGPALLRTLRRRWPGLPAVLMSGYEYSATPRHCVFLRKPFGLGDLAAAVEALAGQPGEAKRS